MPSNYSTVTKNLGLQGTPDSSVDITNKSGEIVTRCWYDTKGRVCRDVDLTNHGNSKDN